MKEIRKIKLKNAEILEKQGMKSICGGSGSSTCSKNGEACSGSCEDGVIYDSKGKVFSTFKRSCNSYGGSGGSIICMCG